MNISTRLHSAISDKRGNLSRIAEKSGVSVEALRKISDGRTKNPGILTVGRIEEAIEALYASPVHSGDDADSERAMREPACDGRR
jgi:DNA-binding phage protein